MKVRRVLVTGTVAALALTACGTSEQGAAAPEAPDLPRATSPIDFNIPAGERYHRTATYPVYLNRPQGAPADEATVAEISTVTPDGNTVIYTDATGKRIGFIDIRDPAKPVGQGVLSLSELGNADDQPTSVAAFGEYVLVVVGTTGGDFPRPSGRVDVVRLSDRTRVQSIDLGGQPDSIAISSDGSFAAIAMENQRDEEFTPPGKEQGDLPQPPTGFVQLLDLKGAPEAWKPRRVDFDVEAARAAGVDTPEDLEPEYVTINSRGQVAVSMQENNAFAILDGRTGAVQKIFSAGAVAVDGIDVKEDATIDQTGSIPETPREPDSIGWVNDDFIATANEGDWKGGTRGWSVFDAATGDVVWDAGNSVEQLAVRTGLHIESRAEKKGPEPEGLVITNVGGTPTALIASERSNFVAVYDVSDPKAPVFRQILPTTPGPEGVLPIPSRNLLAIASEVDDAKVRVRASVNIYGFGDQYAAAGGKPPFPSIVSGDLDGAPIPWGALGALSVDPTDPNRLFTSTDIAYGPSRILGIDLTKTPALIDTQLPITDNGQPVTLDVEGVSARPTGGWVLAVEGEEGPGNQLVFVAADGSIENKVSLPDDVANGLGGQGLEGVAVDGDNVWVAVQREVKTDPKGVVRIGRFTPADNKWEWFGYQLENTTTEGDWVGLSEIQVRDGNLLLLERDKLNGPDAKVKAIYSVKIPSGGEAFEPGSGPSVLPKTLARNLLPDLQATNGFVQEKVEGFAVAGNGNLYVITDNDGVEDANGETQFFDLGPAGEALTS